MTGLRRALEGSIGSGSQGSSQEKAGRNRSSKRNRDGLERMGSRWGVGVRLPQKGSPHPPLEEVLGKGSRWGQ